MERDDRAQRNRLRSILARPLTIGLMSIPFYFVGIVFNSPFLTLLGYIFFITALGWFLGRYIEKRKKLKFVEKKKKSDSANNRER